MHTRNVLNMLLLLMLAWTSLVCAPAFAQTSTASLAGKIEDASGAVLSGVVVIATNSETNETRQTVSDNTGAYLVVSLPVGSYQVKVTAPGFKTKIETGIPLAVGQQVVLNISMPLGQVEESITVLGDPAVVNLSTSSVAGLVGEKEVKDLPLNGRSFDNLITLNTGTLNYTPFSGTAASGGGAGNAFHIVGRRAVENMFLLNGIEYTGESNRSNEPGGVSGQLLGVDAIREFNVLTNAYSAEYGKRPGGQISVVTQSGGNAIHGSAFEFIRNSALDARNYFDAPTSQLGRRIPVFQRNQFGGALGGPIVKDKAFIFGNYEGFRQRLGVSTVAIVPDDNARLGLLPNAQGVPTQVTKLEPRMLPFFALWPKANGPTLGAGLALYTASPKSSIREDFGTTRVDQNLTSKDSFSEAFTIDDGVSFIPQQNPLFYSQYYVRNQVASVQETHIFSPNILNTARFGYSRGAFNFNITPVVNFSPSLLLFSGLEPGSLSIGGGLTTLNGTTTLSRVGGTSDYLFGARNLFTYADDFQMVRGKHHFAVGAWMQRMQDNRNGANRKAGAVTFSTLTTFLQGTESGFQGVPNPTYSGYRMWMGAWYAQDTINLTSRLVVNLGLRHEFTTILSEVHGKIANSVLDSNGIMVTAPVIGKAFPKNDAKWLFGPRVGLAWDVFGNGTTSVRSGFGIHYSLMDYQLWVEDGMSPFNTTVDYGANKPFLSLIPVVLGVAAPPQCSPTVTTNCQIISQKGILSNVAPTAIEWNLSIEQQIAAKTALRIEYVGSHGYHEPISTDQNGIRPLVCSNPAGCLSGGLNKATGLVTQGTLYVPIATARPNPYLTSSTAISSSNSSYNALQVEVKRQFAQGVQGRINYTYSKNLDVADETGGTESANSPPQVLQSFSPRTDWGASSSDVRHVFTVSGTYELPFGKGRLWGADIHGFGGKLISGWQVNTIANLLTGFPFNPLVGSNISGNGNTTNPDRPSLNPAFSGPIITGNPQQWFNPNAFAIPVSGTFANTRKGTFRGPGLAEWDLSLVKNTPLTEKLSSQFRLEAFNMLNHTNFSIPNQTVFSGTAISPTAGRITATATSSRQLQAAIKLIF